VNRIFRRGGGNVVPDGTLVYPFLNPADSTNDLPVELFDGASLALGEIRPKQASKIQMHPVVTLMLWVISGRLALKLKDSESEAPYVLELGAEDGAVARPGTFLQLINNADALCRVLYIVSPAYVFLQTNGKMVYDDAIVFDPDWEGLAREKWRPAMVPDLDRVRAAREEAIRKLKALRRKR
jgi:hypothetical protein